MRTSFKTILNLYFMVISEMKKICLFFLLLSNIYCSQLLDNAEGPLSFFPEASLLQTSTPPRVLGANPADGSIGTPADTKINVIFSEPMNLNYTQSAFSLLRDGLAVEGQFNWIGNVMVFSPNRPLGDPGLYSYTIAKSRAESARGVNLIDDFKSNFSFSIDLDKPRVSQVIPSNGAVGVPANSLITIQFNKPMDKLSVLSSVSISPNVELDIANTLISNNDQTFQFIPRFALNFGTVYQIQVSSTAVDKSGNALAQNSITLFTVGDDLVTPSLTSISTTSVVNFVNQEIFLIDGVNRNDSVFLSFSEPIQPLSVANAIRISPNKSFNIIQISATNFEIRFLEPLDVLEVYALSITDTITDMQNNRLNKQYNYNLRVFGNSTQKIFFQGFYSDAGFINRLFDDRVNLSTPPPANCLISNINECNQSLYLKFCYGESLAGCTDTLPITSQILLGTVRLSINREFTSTIYSCSEYFSNLANATPAPLSPNITSFSTIANCLDRGSTYSITLRGGETGVRDNLGNYMDSDTTILIRFQ
ncbi:Ig-like domain-containing protein [Leptospira jelokensis]|uniref:Ig-like domain-containing protein n=1 Tax=Leptospira jelokensis TaxID=2484931 RepID=UPI001090DE23|nr:Ig-like domain-containing protein [Leptospira jelokensis]TGM06660.1 hypothetical protein EHQ79_01525 [Leptospira jelokensis]